jgi:hypothetical protein
MAEWMRLAPDGRPYWLITRDCPNLIETIPQMEPAENDIEDLNTDLMDHGVDSVSFGLQFIPFIDAEAGGVDYSIIEEGKTTISEDRELFGEDE